MIGFPQLAAATLRANKILGKLKPLVAQTVYQQHNSRISIVYASPYYTWRKLELVPRPRAIHSNGISESVGSHSQASGCLNSSAAGFTMDAIPIRSMSTSKTSMKVSAEAGHDLISFINASPTRKIKHESNRSQKFTH